MAGEDIMQQAVRLGAATDALAALAAHVRLETEQLPADPMVRDLLRSIAALLLGGSTDVEAGPSAAAVVGLARTTLLQAAELVENPGRSGAWDTVDVPLLQSIGRLSIGVADAIGRAGTQLPDLGERLRAPGARFLDVGTGTGWLAMALARDHPDLTVVGIDVLAPALELARGNLAGTGLEDRVELRLQDARTLDEPAGYDAVWLPTPFLAGDVLPDVVLRAARALRQGGWLLLGTFVGPDDDQLSHFLAELRTVRCGGYPFQPGQLVDLLAQAELTDAREVDRTWRAPVRLVVGRRPA
jgi:SAM-dependent methyltransferase